MEKLCVMEQANSSCLVKLLKSCLILSKSKWNQIIKTLIKKILNEKF